MQICTHVSYISLEGISDMLINDTVSGEYLKENRKLFLY